MYVNISVTVDLYFFFVFFLFLLGEELEAVEGSYDITRLVKAAGYQLRNAVSLTIVFECIDDFLSEVDSSS